jgi:hypothetical protein
LAVSSYVDQKCGPLLKNKSAYSKRLPTRHTRLFEAEQQRSRELAESLEQQTAPAVPVKEREFGGRLSLMSADLFGRLAV